MKIFLLILALLLPSCATKEASHQGVVRANSFPVSAYADGMAFTLQKLDNHQYIISAHCRYPGFNSNTQYYIHLLHGSTVVKKVYLSKVTDGLQQNYKTIFVEEAPFDGFSVWFRK